MHECSNTAMDNHNNSAMLAWPKHHITPFASQTPLK